MQRRLVALVFLLAALTPFSAIAQNSRLEFEVASVKPNNTGSGSAINGAIRGDRFSSTNVTVTQLIRAAYGVQEFQISGQPGWFDAARFDIEAKMLPGVRPEDWPLMLQSLLADRFKLMLHRGTKEQSIFALVVAKSGHKLSSPDPKKCDRPNADCSGFRASPSEIIGNQVSMEQR